MVGRSPTATGTRRSSAARSTPSPRSSRRRSRPRGSRSSSCIADATSASGVMPPCRSAMSGSSEPAFTPMRIGRPRSLASLRDELDVLGLADVAGVEPQRLHARFHRRERELVLEVDVGDDRHRRAGHDLRQALGRVLLVARAAHDVAAGGGERVDLRERAVDVGGLRGGHRLHRDRRAAADRHRRPTLDAARVIAASHDGRRSSGTPTPLLTRGCRMSSDHRGRVTEEQDREMNSTTLHAGCSLR